MELLQSHTKRSIWACNNELNMKEEFSSWNFSWNYDIFRKKTTRVWIFDNVLEECKSLQKTIYIFKSGFDVYDPKQNIKHHITDHLCNEFDWLINGLPILFNSLWLGDTKWQYKSGSTLAQVMPCCLMAPRYYLKLSREGIFTGNALKIFILDMSLKIINLILQLHASPHTSSWMGIGI